MNREEICVSLSGCQSDYSLSYHNSAAPFQSHKRGIVVNQAQNDQVLVVIYTDFDPTLVIGLAAFFIHSFNCLKLQSVVQKYGLPIQKYGLSLSTGQKL